MLPASVFLLQCLFLIAPTRGQTSPINHTEGADVQSKIVDAAVLRLPEKTRSELEKAQGAFMQGEIVEANRHLSRALESDPHSAVALGFRAILEMEANRTQDAADDCREAIRFEPEYGPPYLVLGALYNLGHRYDDALIVLATGVRLMPESWQAHFEMGEALFGKSEDQAALAALTEAARLMPGSAAAEDRAKVHFWKGYILVQLKDLSGARPEYEQAIQIAPDSLVADFARQALRVIASPKNMVTPENQQP